MDTALTETPQSVPSSDGKIMLLILAPALVVAGLFYLGGAHELAYGLGGMALLVCIFLAPEIGLYVYCFTQMFDQAMITEETGIFTPSKVLGLVIVLAYLVHPRRRRTPMLLSRPLIFTMLVFGLYGLVTAAVSIAPLAALRYGGQIIVQVMLVVVAIHRLSDRTRITRALVFTVLGGAIGAFMMAGLGARSDKFSGATLGQLSNPNSTALALSLALACVPAAWGFARHKLTRIGLLAAVPLILAAMMMTGSRSALVAVFLAAAMAVLLVGRAGAVQRVAIPLVSTLIIVGAAHFVLQSDLLGEHAKTRLGALVAQGVETGRESRFFIWGAAFQTFLSRPWGFGYGNTAFALELSHGIFIDVHSSVLSALVDGGVVSFALFAWGGWLLFRYVRGIGRANPGIPAMMMFIFLVVSSLTHTIHFSKWFWMPVLFCVVLAEQARREQVQEVREHTPQPEPMTASDLVRQLGPEDAVVY